MYNINFYNIIMIEYIIIKQMIPVWLLSIIIFYLIENKLLIKNFFNMKLINKIIMKISFLWNEAAGIDESTEKGSENYTTAYLNILIFSIFITFIPFLITLNSDFSFILNYTIVIVLLSFLLFTPLALYKIFTEVVESDCSLILIPIIILIESISYFFKILSLTIRIAVNAATEHALTLIFFSLCCFMLESIKGLNKKIISIFFYIFCLIYLIMEIFISLLQIYVINLLAYYYEYENFQKKII